MVTVLVLRPEFEAYANIVYGHLEMAGYNVRKDSNYELSLNSRIRAHIEDTICVIGYEEQENRSVNIRQGNSVESITLNEFVARFR